MPPLHVRRLGYALGAEITGVDLTRPLDDATHAEIQRIWHEHLVVCFPGQELGKDDLVRFASRFGTVDDNKFNKTRDPENAHILFVTNKAVGGKPFDGYKGGQSWHSDRTYTSRPAPATFLFAEELPEVGGNTAFANQYMAFETLSPTMQRIVEGLSAVHDVDRIRGAHVQAADILAMKRREFPPQVHPCVKVHPGTGRKALFLGERVRQFEGLTEEESRPLLDFLNRHAVRYEFTYRHSWRLHDLVAWDNRCTLHLAVQDYDVRTQPRHMMRCALVGKVEGRDYRPEGLAVPTAAELGVTATRS